MKCKNDEAKSKVLTLISNHVRDLTLDFSVITGICCGGIYCKQYLEHDHLFSRILRNTTMEDKLMYMYIHRHNNDYKKYPLHRFKLLNGKFEHC